MATTMGRLAAAVLGDINDFKSDFEEAKKSIGDFENEIQNLSKVGDNLTRVGTAIVTSITDVTLATVKSAEEITLFSEKIKVSQEELQKLVYAAEQQGIGIETLGTNLMQLSKNMVEAVNGAVDAQNAFKELGIDIVDSNGNLKSVESVLLEIADRFAGMSDRTEQAAAAMKLFGVKGSQMIPFLKMGKEGIEELKNEAVDLGFVLNEQTIAQLNQLGEELESVKISFENIGRQIAADAAPALAGFATGANEAVQVINLLPDGFRQVLTQGTLAAGAIMTLAGVSAGLVAKIGQLRIALAMLQTSFAPFLVGSAIFVGLTALLGLFNRIRQEKKLLQTDTNSITDPKELKVKMDTLNRQRNKAQKDIINEYGYSSFNKDGSINKEYILKRAKELGNEKEAQRLISVFENKTNELDAVVQQINNLDKTKRYENIQTSSVELTSGSGKRNSNLKNNSLKSNSKLNSNSSSNFNLDDFEKKLSKSLKDAETEVNHFGDASELAAKKAGLLKSAIIELIKHNEKGQYNKKIAELTEQYKQYVQQAKAVEEALKQEQKSTNLLNQAQQERNNWINRNKTSLELLADALEEQAQADAKNRKALLESAAAIRELEKEQKAYANQTKAANELREAEKKLNEMLGKSIPEWEEYANKLKALAAADGVAEETRKALENVADGIIKAGKAAEERVKQEQLTQIAKEVEQFNLDQQITQLENQKSLLDLQNEGIEARRQELEINKRIAELQIKKLNLDIDSLEAQRKKAEEAKNEVEVKRLNLEIDKANAAIKNYQFKIQLDTENFEKQLKQPIVNLKHELRSNVSSAIAGGLKDGGIKSAINSLGEYMANKFRTKIADALADAFFKSTIGREFEAFFVKIFGGKVENKETEKTTKIDHNKSETDKTQSTAPISNMVTGIANGTKLFDWIGSTFFISLTKTSGESSLSDHKFKIDSSAINYSGLNIEKNVAKPTGQNSKNIGADVASGAGLWGLAGSALLSYVAGSGGEGGLSDNKFAAAGSLLGTIWGPIGSMIGGQIGGFLDNFLNKKDTKMTIQANLGTFVADYATANFKEVVLPSSYMDELVPSGNAVAPVINVYNNIRGSVVAQRDLESMTLAAAETGYYKAKEQEAKWQPMNVKTMEVAT